MIIIHILLTINNTKKYNAIHKNLETLRSHILFYESLNFQSAIYMLKTREQTKGIKNTIYEHKN